jgi:hypothetical protein
MRWFVMTTDRHPTITNDTVPGIEIRRSGRHFALYERGALLALVCYKVGALAVKGRIEALEQQLSNRRERPSVAPRPADGTHETGEPPWNP